MKPGPPLPPVKGLLLAGIVGLIVSGGVLLVPLLDKMPYASILLVALLLYHLFYWGQKSGNPLVTILVLSVTLIPVAGLTSQALALGIATALATGLLIGIFVSLISHAFFPEPDAPKPAASKSVQPAPPAHWIAWRGTLIVDAGFPARLEQPGGLSARHSESGEPGSAGLHARRPPCGARTRAVYPARGRHHGPVLGGIAPLPVALDVRAVVDAVCRLVRQTACMAWSPAAIPVASGRTG